MDKERELLNEFDGVPVIGISRHRLGIDGDGVTTLVAFHGCNLRCKYCLNPKSLGSAEGLERYTPESLYDKVKIDDLYFRSTGGGITFGGGEPCLQADFIVKFRQLCGSDWKIGLETSLNAPFHNIEKLVPVVDEWIVDIKTDDKETYERYTGQQFGPSYQHLRWLINQLGYNSNKLTLRVPVIPGFVDEEMATATMERFERSGISRIHKFTYRTEKPNSELNFEIGKRKCELMKSIRRDLANQFGIEMHQQECHHKGDCPGTCPLCEQDVRQLEAEIKAKKIHHPKVSESVIKNINRLGIGDNSIETIAPSIKHGIIAAPENDAHQLEGDVTSPDEFPPLEGQITDFTPLFKHKKIIFKECALAGVSFHLKKDDDLWFELEEGVELALVRQKNNQYDPNAVAVCLADDFDGDPEDFDFDFILGYIPRTDNAELAAMLDAGYADKFSAKITSFKEYGYINNRIRITIYIETSEPVLVRPDRLRAHNIDIHDLRNIVSEIQDRGTCYCRFGGYPLGNKILPTVGEKIVMIYKQRLNYVFLLLRVIAEGDDCKRFTDSEIDCIDDCLPFILSNIIGPICIRKRDCKFLKNVNIEAFNAAYYLTDELSDEFEFLFRKYLSDKIYDNNIDSDESFDNLPAPTNEL